MGLDHQKWKILPRDLGWWFPSADDELTFRLIRLGEGLVNMTRGNLVKIFSLVINDGRLSPLSRLYRDREDGTPRDLSSPHTWSRRQSPERLKSNPYAS